MANWGALGATILLLVAAAASGGRILGWLGATPRPGERVLYALVLGLTLQGTLLLTLTAAGAMHPLFLWGAVLAPALGTRGELTRLRAWATRAREVLAEVSSIERMCLLAIGAAVLAVLFVGAMVPVTDWDSQMYHLRIPQQLLAEGRLFLPADNNHFSFLGLFHFLYLPLMAIGGDAGPALLNAAMTAVLGVTLAVAGATVLSARTGLLAAIAVWGSSSLLLVGATPRVDTSLATVLAIAHLATLRAFDEDAPWAVPVAALCAAAAFAMKYHALPYIGMLGLAVMWATWRRHRCLASTVRDAVVASALAAAIVTPWLVKNYVFLEAPLFPFFAEERMVPFLADIVGRVTPPPDLAREALSMIGDARERVSFGGLLFRPSSLTVETEAKEYTRNLLFAVLPLALLFVRDRRIVLLTVPGLAYLTFMLGWFSGTNLRYIVPALPMLALCAVDVARRLAGSVQDQRRVHTLLALLAALAALPGLRSAAVRLVSLPRAQVALGLWQRETLLLQETPYRVTRMTEDLTPTDARVLMLFEARGLYHRREVLQDNLLMNWPILEHTGATDRCLAGTGITHVLVNGALPSYYERRGSNLAAARWDRFPAFAERCLASMGQAGSVVLFRVR